MSVVMVVRDGEAHLLEALESLRAQQILLASEADARAAKQEQTKKEQIAELMKQYNAFFRDGKYKEAMAMASRLGDGLERSDAYRSGQYRQAPLPQNSGVR